jgi:excisionase family DNA binding protein
MNEVREILKVRHETVRKLIEDGKIEVIIIGKRIKIPMRSLEKFIEENARVISNEQKEEHLTTSRKYINDHVDSIIIKHTRRI